MRVPALRTAFKDRRVDVDGLEADTAERLSWWQRRRRRRRDLYPLVGRAASDAMARGARRVDPSDVVRALGKEPEVDAARRLRTVGVDAEQLRRIADEVDADRDP